MDNLYLVRPSLAYADQIAAYRREFLERGDSMDGTSDLREYADPARWLGWLERLSQKETCPFGLVPSVQFLCVRGEDDKVVGMANIRLELNDYLRLFGGHIGYSIRPDERRKGYAKAQLSLVLKEAATLGLNKVLITCNKSNEASRRTILACGGRLENEVLEKDEGELIQRYWVEISRQ